MKPKLTARQEKIAAIVRQFHADNPGASAKESAAAIVRATLTVLHKKKHGMSRDAFVDLAASLQLESDRGCVLVAATIIDQELEHLLREFFLARSSASKKDLDFFFAGVMPPLRSTALKIRMAFVLGLIDLGVRAVLLQLQELRSKVAAHSQTTMFLKPDQIVRLLESTPGTRKVKPGEDTDEKGPGRPFCISDVPKDADSFTPKLMFVASASSLISDLEAARKKVRRARRKPASPK